MSSESPELPPAAGIPPMQPVYVERRVRTKWPTVLGVIAIVCGALAALTSLWGFIGTSMVQWGDTAQQALMEELMHKQKPYTLFIAAIGLMAAILLLAAGVGLVQRRAWGVTLARWWAVIKIVVVLVGVVIGWQMQEEVMARLSQQPNMPGMSSMTMGVMRLFGIVFGLAWGWALPGFMLIWFSRASIKAETAGWAGSRTVEPFGQV